MARSPNRSHDATPLAPRASSPDAHGPSARGRGRGRARAFARQSRDTPCAARAVVSPRSPRALRRPRSLGHSSVRLPPHRGKPHLVARCLRDRRGLSLLVRSEIRSACVAVHGLDGGGQRHTLPPPPQRACRVPHERGHTRAARLAASGRVSGGNDDRRFARTEFLSCAVRARDRLGGAGATLSSSALATTPHAPRLRLRISTTIRCGNRCVRCSTHPVPKHASCWTEFSSRPDWSGAISQRQRVRRSAVCTPTWAPPRSLKNRSGRGSPRCTKPRMPPIDRGAEASRDPSRIDVSDVASVHAATRCCSARRSCP